MDRLIPEHLEKSFRSNCQYFKKLKQLSKHFNDKCLKFKHNIVNRSNNECFKRGYEKLDINDTKLNFSNQKNYGQHRFIKIDNKLNSYTQLDARHSHWICLELFLDTWFKPA